ncbi:MAG: DUF1259 domain-containing protein [Bacillota bacterium]|nr:DUF1259 domain-containing protein [Bacillota bacterium]
MSTSYTVQFGDTLQYIAQRFGTTLPRLIQMNNIYYPYLIYVGQRLDIPKEQNFQTVDDGVSDYQFAGNNHTTTYRYSAQTPSPMVQESVEKIIGKKGTAQDGVLKFTFPRNDLKVSIGPVSVEPDLALTSWVAFNHLGNQSMLMGDLVLLESEVGPVMSSLLENGIQVTGLHNHLLFETPRIMYMHIKGEGNPVKIAEGVRNALSLTATPIQPHQQPPSRIDWSLIENILGRKGTHKNNVLQFSFPRTTTIYEDGQPLSPAMGISHGINFQNLGDKVAAAGDLVLFAHEVNPVAAILKKNNIAVTAVHNHMLTETPRLFFMHFWAVDKPEHLAQAFKSVLNLAR